MFEVFEFMCLDLGITNIIKISIFFFA